MAREFDMKSEEQFEELMMTIEELVERSLESAIVVEGERDVRSLRRLGVAGKVLHFNRGLSVFAFVEGLSREHRSLILMTDWDSKGGRLCRQLREACEANGIRPLLDFRARLARLCRKDIKDVESVSSYVEDLRHRYQAGRWKGKLSKRWHAPRHGGQKP